MKGSIRLLRRLAGRQWGVLAVAMVSTVFFVLADLARPFPLKLLIDGLLGGEDGGTSASGLASGELTALVAIAGLVLCIAGVEAVALYQMDVRLQRAGENVAHSLRVAVYGQLQRLSLSFHEERQHGDLLTRATGDVQAVGKMFSDTLGVLASSALLLIGMVAVSFALDPVLALVTIAIAPFLALLTLRFRRRVKAVARRQRAKEGEIASLAAETLSSMREVKAFGSERFELERLKRRSEERWEAGVEASRMEARFAGFGDLLSAAGAAIVLVVGAIRVANGALSVGDLVVMISYARKIHKPLRDLVKQAGKVAKAVAQAERIAEVLTADQVLSERQGAYRGPKAKGDLELDGVSFAYAPDRSVLQECSLRVTAGERVALMGPSGAGKSTIAALLARFYDPASGSVRLDGHDLRECSLSWLRDQIGLVLQETVLFTGTVAENIAYGVDAEPDDVVRAATRAGADAFIRELPEGYDTMLGPRGVALSGGQRQRVAIARTLLRDPPVLVLDEPTVSLDANSEAEVLAGLETLIEGRTVLIITHSPALSRWAHRVVMLEGGRVVERPSAESPPAPPRSIHAGVVQGGRPIPVPRDDALPQMGQLLSVDAIAPALQGTLAGDATLTEVQVHRLRYEPGRHLVVGYEVRIGGDPHPATAMTSAEDHLEGQALRPDHLALAMMVNGRSPAVRPLRYDRTLRCLLQWFPLDLSLPALAEPPLELRQRLRALGIDVPLDPHEPTPLSYEPGERAVVRLEGCAVTFFANGERFRAATEGLRLAHGLAPIVVRPPWISLPDRRMIVQGLVPGRAPSDPVEVADRVGQVLAELHGSTAGDGFELRASTPSHQLAAAAASAELVGALLPTVRGDLARILGALEGALPTADRPVLSHGDFGVHRLLEVGSQIVLADLDEPCLAPAALDVASYAGHLVTGSPDDLAVAVRTLEAMLDGYGRRPPAMPWYLATVILRRSARPFLRAEPDWPERVRAAIAAAEEASHL